MNNNEEYFIGGAGKGGESRKPVESPEGVLINNTRFVTVTNIETLDLLSEGEIAGLVTGEWKKQGILGATGYSTVSFQPYDIPPQTTNGRFLRSVYWNEVPVVDVNNKYNFQSIDLRFTNGLPKGGLTSTISENLLNTDLTISRPINERLRGPNAGGSAEDFSKKYRILNRECNKVRVNVRFPAMYEISREDKTYGDTNPTSVTYSIFYRPLYSLSSSNEWIFIQKETVKGKITSGYIRSSIITFDGNLVNTSLADFIGWEIKISRVTPDSTSTQVTNKSFIDSITEIYDTSFCYPYSAIVAAKFNAEYFSQVPSRAFDVELLKVFVPSNYNPISKTYDGTWDGTFSSEKVWTDNPAWCYYDLITNKRYGLGKYINNVLVDKWTLYEISQQCDVLVSDGEGGVEPRFTCNLYIGSREEAYRVVNDFASIFRGMTYYAGGSIFASQDIQKDNYYTFTNANVEEGNFEYSTSSKRNRHSVCIVRYNDKNNYYRPAVEYVEDLDAIKKYGIKELELTAFGCTSRGQAIRYGKWALASENLETEIVSFVGGLESAVLRPGDIIKTSDYNKSYERFGGRLLAYTRLTGDNLLNYQSTGYKYQTGILPALSIPSDYYLTGYDDSTWSNGTGAFGEGNTCDYSNTIQTRWPLGTESEYSHLLIRKDINLSAGSSAFGKDYLLRYTVDNNISGLYFNNTSLITNTITGGGCKPLGYFTALIPSSLLVTGKNVLAAHLIDAGIQSYFDAEIVPYTSNESQQKFLLDSPITGLLTNQTYDLTILTPTYNYDTTQLTSLTGFTSSDIPNIRRSHVQTLRFFGNNAAIVPVSGIGIQLTGTTEITPPSQFDGKSNILDLANYELNDNAVWTVSISGGKPISSGILETYRVISINEEEVNKYKVSALQYNPQKYNVIESGLRFESNATSTASAPTSLLLDVENDSNNPNIKVIRFNVVYPDTTPNTLIFVSKDDATFGGYSGPVPPQKYLYQTLYNTFQGYYTPVETGNYYFRAFGLSNAGQISNSYTNGVPYPVNISDVNLLTSIEIAGLRLATGTTIDAAGSTLKTQENFNDYSPDFVWNLGFASTRLLPSNGFPYRITARKPSGPTSTIPDDYIYFQQTGYYSQLFDTPSYTWDISKNPTGLRTYDLVVEVMDWNGNSSAGGNFIINGDADYTNAVGYDIVSVDNPKIRPIRLTNTIAYAGSPIETCTNSFFNVHGICTDQYIDNAGNFNITITSGSVFTTEFLSDISGAYIYYSESPFGSADTYLNEFDSTSVANVTKKRVNLSNTLNSNSIITFPLGLNITEGYFALGAYDSMDAVASGLHNPGADFSKSLYTSNVVKVQKRDVGAGPALEIDCGYAPNNGTNPRIVTFNRTFRSLPKVVISRTYFGQDEEMARVFNVTKTQFSIEGDGVTFPDVINIDGKNQAVGFYWIAIGN